MDTIELLQHRYRSNHACRVSPLLYQDRRALWPYFDENYDAIAGLSKDARIIEIGPGSGALMAWLIHRGFANLTGIEVSREEADTLIEDGLPVIHGDAESVLRSEPAQSVDAVIFKAVLEHLSKDYAVDLFHQIARVIRPSGVVLVDVPNMDWLLASHERYMDLTHRTGYTRESIYQMMIMFFQDVEVQPGRERPTSLKSAVRIRLVKPVVVAGLRLLLRILGEGAPNVLFESRSIIALARNPRS